ncbi:transcriptional regulator, LacI family [Lachnospiraceae bacterium]|nr:transcriptional regulator, LacI family [Lachnospiraceae bacterium]
MPATIKDIKEETGLSLATISKYLNGGNVLPENRKKIEAAINKLHYEVNEIARGLVTNSTRTIGVSVYDIADMFNGILIHHIGRELSRFGYGMMVVDAANDVKKEKANIRFLVNKKVDGIIMVPSSMDSSVLADAVKAEIPAVLLDGKFKDRTFDSVTINNRESAALAVGYLIRHGHTKIAMIGSNSSYTSNERLKGYRDAMEDAGLEIRSDYSFVGELSMEYGYKAMNEIIRMKDRPTAVFSANYELNLGVVMAMNEAKIIYPDEISVVGFDNLILSQVLKTSLTAVEQPMERFGVKGVEILMKRIHEKKKPVSDEEKDFVNIILNTHLIEGSSVKELAP